MTLQGCRAACRAIDTRLRTTRLAAHPRPSVCPVRSAPQGARGSSMQAEINGTELHYVELGQGRGMLVMHGGLGLEHRYFRPSLDPLAEQVRLVYYDHRLHGQSGRPPIETLTHEQLVDDAEALRQHLGLGQMVLFGHSYGGTLAMMYALKYPQNLAGLVLSNTYAAFDYPEVVQANAAR